MTNKNSTGPSTWPKEYPDSCSYEWQSPINIATADVSTDYSLHKIVFFDSEPSGATYTLSNNGHSGKHYIFSFNGRN